jgi:alkylated DNA repair dioxygenase AlkB
MNLLFPDQATFPDGFSYYPDFLTVSEEKRCIDAVMPLELHNLVFQGFEAKRKVQSFGFDYNFDKRSITKGKDIPGNLKFLIDKAANFLSLSSTDLAEVLVTDYPKGSVINWHRDAPPFDTIVGISLLADCDFRLRPYKAEKKHKSAILHLTVQRRSLYIIRGEARNAWEHSISPVKERRFSITLRTLRAR